MTEEMKTNDNKQNKITNDQDPIIIKDDDEPKDKQPKQTILQPDSRTSIDKNGKSDVRGVEGQKPGTNKKRQIDEVENTQLVDNYAPIQHNFDSNIRGKKITETLELKYITLDESDE